jgi:hypothetical protein
MEHLPPNGIGCEMCSAHFQDEVELAKHKQSHEASGMGNGASGSDSPVAKGPGTDHENGVMDPPSAVGNASGNRPDAKRDASPDQGSELVEAD